MQRVRKKLVRQQQYAEGHLKPFPNRRFMFWAPIVPRGRLLETLGTIEGLEIVVNAKYRAAVDELRRKARATERTGARCARSSAAPAAQRAR